MNKKNKFYDITIIGFGIIGGSTAIGLANEKKWKIALIEKNKKPKFSFVNFLKNPNIRVSAINYSSVKFLESLGIWKNIKKSRIIYYDQLEVYERNKYKIIFNSEMLNLPFLGCIFENKIFQLTLWNLLNKFPELTMFSNTKLKNLKYKNKIWEITLNNKNKIYSKLIIGADGVFSKVRYYSGIKNLIHRYSQLCMLIIIKRIDFNEEKNIIWQKFCLNGPKALLPLFNNWACLIWYDIPSKIKTLRTMSFNDLEKEITYAFPKRLGKIKVISKDIFQLIDHKVEKYIHNGLILIGDAAHSIHPLAGQGINLGLRDANLLINLLKNKNNKDLFKNFEEKFLIEYQSRRIIDIELMRNCINTINTIFCSHSKLLKHTRNFGFNIINKTKLIKKIILKYALGLYNI